MQWQMWTAFGIMLGYAADLAFYSVADRPGIIGLNWRLMLGSAMLPAVIVCCVVFLCPESPRYYMSRGRHASAYRTMCALRFSKIQAARDTFYMAELLRAEENMKIGQSKIKELWTVPRNRRAMVASEIVMFMQQVSPPSPFTNPTHTYIYTYPHNHPPKKLTSLPPQKFCGINVIAYYSTAIFSLSGFTPRSSLTASLGFGIINFVFALPAIHTIDTFGRRNLLLTTFPLMALSLLFTGFSFWIPPNTDARVACIALGIYLFGVVYSPGEGPVPFTYSAEAYPLYVRTLGMSLATATTWFFNAGLSITWPSLQRAFGSQGAFGWYAGWNVVGWWLVLLFMPVSCCGFIFAVFWFLLVTFMRSCVDGNYIQMEKKSRTDTLLGNKRQNARRTRSDFQRTHTSSRCIRSAPDSIFLQAVYFPEGGATRAIVRHGGAGTTRFGRNKISLAIHHKFT